MQSNNRDFTDPTRRQTPISCIAYSMQEFLRRIVNLFFRTTSVSPTVPVSPEPGALPSSPPSMPPPPPPVVPPAVPPIFQPQTPAAEPLPATIKRTEIVTEQNSPLISEEQLKQVVPNLPADKCAAYLPCLLQAVQEFEINSPMRVAAFIAQTAHESAGYRTFIENLNYSAEALTRVWPSRFPKEVAVTYARNPEKIANRAYASRIGNGDEASGDGWRFRGRGAIQVTGRSNYQACGVGLGLDLFTSPELLEQPLHAFRSAAWFWKSRNLNTLADKDDIVGITEVINGGLNGLEERKNYYNQAKSILGLV